VGCRSRLSNPTRRPPARSLTPGAKQDRGRGGPVGRRARRPWRRPGSRPGPGAAVRRRSRVGCARRWRRAGRDPRRRRAPARCGAGQGGVEARGPPRASRVVGGGANQCPCARLRDPRRSGSDRCSGENRAGGAGRRPRPSSRDHGASRSKLTTQRRKELPAVASRKCALRAFEPRAKAATGARTRRWRPATTYGSATSACVAPIRYSSCTIVPAATIAGSL
jgi:hypothetical protein